MSENVTQLAQNETQKSIVDWATKTFGPPENSSIIAARALEEGAELASLFFNGDFDPDGNALDGEIADVFVVSCQVAAMFNITLQFVEGKNQNIKILIPQCVNILAVILAATVDENIHITPHLRTLQSTLANLAKTIGVDSLQNLVNDKMAINHDRKWAVSGSGVGQHVEGDPED